MALKKLPVRFVLSWLPVEMVLIFCKARTLNTEVGFLIGNSIQANLMYTQKVHVYDTKGISNLQGGS